MKFESKYKAFFHENTFEAVVCEMADILSGVGGAGDGSGELKHVSLHPL